MNEARSDINEAWDALGDRPNKDAVPYLLAAIAESVMALTEAVLTFDPTDDEGKMERLRSLVGR